MANLVLLKGTQTLLVPPVTDPYEDGKDQGHETLLGLEVGNHLGPPAFFHKGPFRQVRGPHLLLVPGGQRQMIEIGLRIIEQTPTGFGKVPLGLGDLLVDDRTVGLHEDD